MASGWKVMLVLLVVPGWVEAGDAVTPLRLLVEPPTLTALGLEWKIEGDENRNAAVQVRYRRAGAAQWKEALPLLRLGGERVYRRDLGLDYTVPEMLAGSIFDLEPDTEYEVRLEMRDPDGVSGQAVRDVKARTRAEPREPAGGRRLHVYPPDWKGPKQEPAFTGLMKAYYGAGSGDWAVVSERMVGPGDVILVHAGRYKSDRLSYSDPLSLPFHGAYVLTAKGTPDRPIVIRAAGDGEVIFDGDGAYRLFDVMAADYHIFEGLTIRNTDIAFYAGLKRVGGARGLTVRRCRIEDVGIAVTTEYAGSKDFYIADNVMIGRDDRYRLLGWYNPGVYGASLLRSYYAVKVYGSGHVICHNSIAYFHDGVCVSTYGRPEADEEQRAVSIDIYNNDIHLMTDDFIEADGGVHNIRVLRNRGVNAAQCGLSAQPVYGGPAYFVRNIVYHVPTGVALKFKVKPAGLVLYHNTIVGESTNAEIFSNAHARNNLFLGTGAPGRPLFYFPNATAYSSFDYNGYRPNPGVSAPYHWKAPAGGRLRDYDLENAPFQSFRTLAELAEATGQERHGVELDYDVFENLTPPDSSRPMAVYKARNLDFRLKAGGKAVDRGLRLPNINDDFLGAAPDLGALEAGAPIPIYGPRPGER
jgi:hypothetical protein